MRLEQERNLEHIQKFITYIYIQFSHIMWKSNCFIPKKNMLAESNKVKKREQRAF